MGLIGSQLASPAQGFLAQGPQSRLVLHSQVLKRLRHLHNVSCREATMDAFLLQSQHHLRLEGGVLHTLLALHGGQYQGQVWPIKVHLLRAEQRGQGLRLEVLLQRAFALQGRTEPEKPCKALGRRAPASSDHQGDDVLYDGLLILRLLYRHPSKSLHGQQCDVCITPGSCVFLQLLCQLQDRLIFRPLLSRPRRGSLGHLVERLRPPARVPAVFEVLPHNLHDCRRTLGQGNLPLDLPQLLLPHPCRKLWPCQRLRRKVRGGFFCTLPLCWRFRCRGYCFGSRACLGLLV
mmetsp:Transcript_59948/g.140250  ORF Transcript_59948/g.140250 Transcript_59948/m.140250 type:complete len:291 (-) Transcript_59948:76-948(-)